MVTQSPDIFTERVNKLMKRNALSKKEMASRLNVDYSTFWRKLNGKRNVDIPVLIQIAGILGTSVSYLVGETDNPYLSATIEQPIAVQTNDPSRTIVSEPGRLSFHNGDVSIDIPDTPANKKWFNDFIKSVMLMKSSKQEIA